VPLNVARVRPIPLEAPVAKMEARDLQAVAHFSILASWMKAAI
jgi:hypothetical protein